MMIDQTDELSPGQRVAWHRVRRGLSQEVLAGLVGRTEDWLSKIENDRAALDRLSVIRALADALGISVFDLIGEASPETGRDERRHEHPGVARVRAALLDYRLLSPLLSATEAEGRAPQLHHLRSDLAEVMDAYQASRYRRMLRRLPELLIQTQVAAREYSGDVRGDAERLTALASQSAAALLTKLGQSDLAWIASQRGLAAAERSKDSAVTGSLLRSVIHALHTMRRTRDAADMTRLAADWLGRNVDSSQPRSVSVYGTLLLAGAAAAARAGDRQAAAAYLDEAGQMATRLGTDTNYLWTAFGPTNVDIHRVTTAMSLGDVEIALRLIPDIETVGLPPERRVRYALDVVNAYYARNRIDEAIDELLAAERRAPEQVHHHVMSRQLVNRLRVSTTGRRHRRLAELARRMKII